MTSALSVLTAWTAVPDWNPWFNEGSGIALADISGNGRLDLIVFMIDGVPDAPNVGYYRIGWDLDTVGRVSSWSPWMTVPDWFSWVNAGADIAVCWRAGRQRRGLGGRARWGACWPPGRRRRGPLRAMAR
jgi:hypothetical protein